MPDSFAATGRRQPRVDARERAAAIQAVAAHGPISGLSRDEQHAYVAIVADLKAKPGLDEAVARAADWLLLQLQGHTFDSMRLARVA